ncbi:MAG: aldo/keto reductase, partial [Candidatus Shapirobacteria bacterium]|nr:aldo/keto reductase [Candidatus Shapirobacteria bacterium]
MRTIKLAKGVDIPVLGLGTWNLKGNGCVEAVKNAIGIGYRLIDTAEMYGNHREIALAIKNSGVSRKDIFITTKVPPFKLWKNIALESAKRYCQELGTDYLDLLLIHWPNPFIKTEETLDVFEKLQKDGVIRSYGVSNFGITRLNKGLDEGYKIVNNQVRFHPSHNDKELKKFCDENKVVVTAYSPISQGKDLRLSKIMNLAKKY